MAIDSVLDSDFLSSGCTPPGKENSFPAFNDSMMWSKLGYFNAQDTILIGISPLGDEEKSHFHVAVVSVTGTMSIQSTGQGSTHKSHPVHSSAITVCMCLAAPSMASTGQA